MSQISHCLYIASHFSWQIVIGNAGPASALDSMGAKRILASIF